MFTRTILITSAIAVSAFAAAQSSTFPALAVSGGIFFPSNGTFRNAFSNTGFTLAVDATLGQTLMVGTNALTPSIELGWTRNGSGDRLDTWHLTANGRMRLGAMSNAGGLSPYLLIGVGAFRHDSRIGGISDNDTTFGGVLGLGADLQKNMAVEAAYRFSGKTNGTSTDGFFARLRFRF